MFFLILVLVMPTSSLAFRLHGNVTIETEEDVKHEEFAKKKFAVLGILLFGVAIGLVINFVNLHTDFQDLKDFFHGYQVSKSVRKGQRYRSMS